METLHRRYRAAVAGLWPGWWVTWPLTRKIQFGDVYLATPSNIVTAGTLTDRGLTVSPRAGTLQNDMLYDAAGKVSIRFKTAGSAAEGFSALATADAGALVEFRHDSAVLAAYTGVTSRELGNVSALAAELVSRCWAGRWQPGEVAVTGVVTARRGTVLVAQDRGAAAELRISGTAGSGPLTIGDLAGTVSAARSQHVGLTWSGRSLTPFFQVVGVREDWRGRVAAEYGPRQPRRGAFPSPVPGLLLDEATAEPFSVLEVLSSDRQPAEWAAGTDATDEAGTGGEGGAEHAAADRPVGT
jgi:hypothetical protein